MFAAYYRETGEAAHVLETGAMPVPVPAAGEVLVRLCCSGVNPSDVKKRAGKMPAPVAFGRIVPHSDGAGLIEAVGAGVDPARIGSRVWLWNAQWRRAMGTAAPYCALPSAQAVPMAQNVGFEAGACLGIPAQTAWSAVMDGHPAPGRRVLVHGGAGAVGALAIAIAAEAGASVIATTSSPEKAAIARGSGASHVLDYRKTDVVQAVNDLTAGAGVDHIVDVDLGANHGVNGAILAEGGSIAAYSAPSAPVFPLDYYAFAARAARLRFVQVYLLDDTERQRAVSAVSALAARGVIAPVIARRYPLDQIVEAHLAQERGGLIGNIILDIAEP
ncbi:MAG: NADPH:quinone reductase [Pseudomonadota bacterium]